MTFSRIGRLRLTAASLVALAAGSLAACAPEPEPTPTPTAAFSSEGEAFAAAEEVYRAYLEAEDAKGNGEKGDDPQSFLTGSALDDAIDAERSFQEQGIRLVGATKLLSFEGIGAEIAQPVADIQVQACIDVHESRVLNRDNEDITPLDRPESWLLEVSFVGDRTQLLISDSVSAGSDECS